MTESSILIVGAGIAGLSVARALQTRDLTFDIVERAPEPSSAGAGIFLPANAVRALADLGVTGVGHPIVRHRVLDRRGRTLVDMPFSTIWGDAGECRAVRRADLHQALADGVKVRHGVAVRRVRDGVVEFDDGTTRQYDLIVAADGIHSTVRTGGTPQPVGLVAWRFLASGLPDEGVWSAWQDRDRTLLAIALGGGDAYCYADAGQLPSGDWRELFSDFADPVPSLVKQGAGAHVASIEEVGPVFSDDPRTVLVGDAAHAFSPNMAQGAALAFEDALVLAESLDPGSPGPGSPGPGSPDHGSPDAGSPDHGSPNDGSPDHGSPGAGSPDPGSFDPKAFRARREPRATWVRDHTHQRDRTRHLPPLVRNTVLRLAGRRLITSQFAPLRDRP